MLHDEIYHRSPESHTHVTRRFISSTPPSLLVPPRACARMGPILALVVPACARSPVFTDACAPCTLFNPPPYGTPGETTLTQHSVRASLVASSWRQRSSSLLPPLWRDRGALASNQKQEGHFSFVSIGSPPQIFFWSATSRFFIPPASSAGPIYNDAFTGCVFSRSNPPIPPGPALIYLPGPTSTLLTLGARAYLSTGWL